jgi:hypothetical protein
MASIGDTFTPGQKVPESGIYDVVHDLVHRDRHQATCVEGETFPPCHHCGNNVRFRLAKAAIQLNSHKHFKRK